jgi:hypothetical protein
MRVALSLDSPGQVVGLVGATMVQKVGVALSLVGDDQRQVACTGAILELGGQIGVAAVVDVGTGGVAAVLTAASLTASTLRAYNACIGPAKGARNT